MPAYLDREATRMWVSIQPHSITLSKTLHVWNMYLIDPSNHRNVAKYHILWVYNRTLPETII